MTTLVHVAGVPAGGRQTCGRCGYQLLDRRGAAVEFGGCDGGGPAWLVAGDDVVEQTPGGALVDAAFLPSARRAQMQLMPCRGLP